jgi:hypothetical protein
MVVYTVYGNLLQMIGKPRYKLYIPEDCQDPIHNYLLNLLYIFQSLSATNQFVHLKCFFLLFVYAAAPLPPPPPQQHRPRRI